MIKRIQNLKRKGGIKWIFINTIPYFVCKYFDSLIGILMKTIYLRKPMKDVIIIESHNDFDSNGGAFYDYLMQNEYNKKYKIVWFLGNRCPGKLPENVIGVRYNRLSIKRWYYHCIAKFIIWGHQTIDPIRKGQISVFTSHGPGGFKNTKEYEPTMEGSTYILSLSTRYRKTQFPTIYASKRLISIGYPEHDVLYSGERNEIKKITTRDYKKVILWLPTFRNNILGDRNDSFKEQPIGISLFSSISEYNKLDSFLREKDILLIIKLHPMEDISNLKAESTKNIIIVTREDAKKINLNVNKLMLCSDALLSDYSSVSYTYLHLDRPIAYVLDDMDDYKLGFVVDDIRELMAGQEIYCLDDLKKFIDDVDHDEDPYKIRRKQIRDYIFDYQDGNSSKRLAELLQLEHKETP